MPKTKTIQPAANNKRHKPAAKTTTPAPETPAVDSPPVSTAAQEVPAPTFSITGIYCFEHKPLQVALEAIRNADINHPAEQFLRDIIGLYEAKGGAIRLPDLKKPLDDFQENCEYLREEVMEYVRVHRDWVEEAQAAE